MLIKGSILVPPPVNQQRASAQIAVSISQSTSSCQLKSGSGA